ncbi:MAG: glycosyltransferase family 2 protein [Solimonas sp.]
MSAATPSTSGSAPPAAALRRRSLSVMIICCNEADRIRACLDSVAGWADEIVVFDSGSRDGTADIARRYTDKVFVTDWPGYGPQRNRALLQCTGDWVFSLDADEALTPALRDEIDTALADPALPYTMLKMPWRTWFFGKPLRFGRYTSPQGKLFKREGARYRDHQVHESLVMPVRLDGFLKAPLDHYSWRDYQHAQEKHLKYACLLAQQKNAAGKRGSMGMATLRFFTDFVQQYVLRLCLLDGWRGFLISLILAQYAFHKYAALATLQARERAALEEQAAPTT